MTLYKRGRGAAARACARVLGRRASRRVSLMRPLSRLLGATLDPPFIARRPPPKGVAPLPGRRLHADQPVVDAALVQRLIALQHPQWAGLPIERAASDGTTNAIFRLGTAAAVRLPLVRYGEEAIDVEGRWLPQMAPRLPLAVPEQLATGEPDAGYPFRWSVHRWIEGEPVSRAPVGDLAALAEDLAAWLEALHRVDTTGGRDAALHDLRGVPRGAARRHPPRRGDVGPRPRPCALSRRDLHPVLPPREPGRRRGRATSVGGGVGRGALRAAVNQRVAVP